MGGANGRRGSKGNKRQPNSGRRSGSTGGLLRASSRPSRSAEAMARRGPVKGTEAQMKQREVAKRPALELVVRRLTQQNGASEFCTHPTDGQITVGGPPPAGRPRSLYAIWCALCRGRYNCGLGRSLPHEGCDPAGVQIFEDDLLNLFQAEPGSEFTGLMRTAEDAAMMQESLSDMIQRWVHRHCEPSKIFRALASSRTGELPHTW